MWLLEFIRASLVRQHLPDRVQQAMNAEQAQSEIIVTWVQAGAIVTFTALYALTPKAFPPDITFEPVPWTLAAYAIFTAARLWLAYARRLTAPFLYVSVIVDIAVLIGTIWTFHLQYQAPASLYLKAPTLMYVFILIALRTLRFEPRFVIAAGAMTAVGWAVLLGYALLTAELPGMITRDYRVYMTSYRILIGAEIDKIISILMVTGILALALGRARRLLIAAITEDIASHDLARFFSPAVAATIRRSNAGVMAGAAERREAAIITLDLRGFTLLSAQLEPDELMALLGEYQSRLVPVIQRHNGSIDKYLGDGILASFGAVTPSTRPAADALAAMTELLTVTAAWKVERRARGLSAPDVGAAMAAGPVLFGIVGHETRLEYTVIGDTVNLAAKLEKHTKTECVRALTTAGAYRLALSQGAEPVPGAEARRMRCVDGVDGSVELVVFP